MNHRVFLFDLDATVTKEEILPALSEQVGLTREISELTERTMRGELPFKSSFLARVEMLRPIDDLIYNDAYMSFESLDRIECGSGMGAKPGHPIIEEICESYEKRPYLKSDGTWDNSTCPVRYTQVIEKHGLKKNGGFQFVEDITVYPFEVLTGKSFDTGIIYSTDLSYTVHHHNGSWIPGPARRAVLERYEKIRKWMGEIGRT